MYWHTSIIFLPKLLSKKNNKYVTKSATKNRKYPRQQPECG